MQLPCFISNINLKNLTSHSVKTGN